MVRNLVASQPGGSEALTGERHQLRRQRLLRQIQLTPLLTALKHRAWLHRQVIHRDMGGIHGDGLRQLLLPGEAGLSRQVLDQIKTPGPQRALPQRLPHPAAGL